MSERIAGAFTPAAGGPRAPVAARIERLKRRVAGGDPVRFARYLRARAWDQAVLARALGAVDCSGDALPDWSLLLGALATLPIDHRDPTGAAEASARTPEPFEEALEPFIALARRELAARARQDGAATDEAFEGLVRGLRRSLSRIASRTLITELAGFRASLAGRVSHANAGGDAGVDVGAVASASAGAGAGANANGGANAGASAYVRFITALRAGGLERLLREYPVLARLLATRVRQWIDASSELLDRLARDAPEIARAWNRGAPLGPVVEITTDLSDPHRGGRSVSALTFACGLRAVYKPRSLANEAAFAALVGWLNARSLSLPLRAPEAIDRGAYGWMAFAEASACVDERAVERYYRRAGMLLCLAYVLGGSDLHHGNVIASGEHPVLIDLEAFVGAPRRPDEPHGVGHDPASQQVWDSVFRTGLVPVHRLGLRGHPQREGGLAVVEPHAGRPVPQWHGINTDAMTMTIGSLTSRGVNVPTCGGIVAPAEAHAEAVAAGFTEMATRLRAERATLLAPHGPLEAFRHSRTRVVLRDTAVYATLLEQGLHPRRLRDGADWSLEFELLKAAATRDEATPRSWESTLAEERALSRLDVPLFTASSDTLTIEADDGRLVGDRLAESGFAGLTARLEELDEARTRAHVHSIRLTLRGGEPDVAASRRSSRRDDNGNGNGNRNNSRNRNRGSDSNGGSNSNSEDSGLTANDGDGQRAGDDDACDWIEEARAIAGRLRAAAEQGSDGAPRWVGIRGRRGAAQRRVQDVGWDLYGGRCGIALFFAAMERQRVARESSFAARVLAPLVDDLNAGRGLARRLASEELGAFGRGGVVYGLTVAATLLRSDAVRAAAVRAAEETLTIAAIEADRRFDVMSGAAGAVLALLAVTRIARPREREWLMARARHGGRHLLAYAIPRGPRDRRAAWRTLANGAAASHGLSAAIAPFGVAHGAAGIGVALARLFACTGDVALRQCAATALAPSSRDDERGAVTVAEAMRDSWCQGDAGIALARLDAAIALDRPALREAGLASLAELAACGPTATSGRYDPPAAAAPHANAPHANAPHANAPHANAPHVNAPHANAAHANASHANATHADAADADGFARLARWDMPCCGNAGRVAVLSSASRLTGDLAWAHHASRAAARMVARARERRGYAVAPVDDLFCPGFYQGLAGIGYELLRLRDSSLPAVLMWE